MNISDFLKIYKILINWFQTETYRVVSEQLKDSANFIRRN